MSEDSLTGLRDRMQNLAVKHGMTRGPFSHGIMSSPQMTFGGGPDHPIDTWKAGLVNTEETLSLVVDRLECDYTGAPVLMRKTPTLAEFCQLQQRCAGYLFYCSLLKSTVTDATYHSEEPKLRKKFMLHYLDMDIDDHIKKGNAPDPADIPAFKAVLDSFNSAVEKRPP